MSKIISRKEYKQKKIPDPARTKDLIFCITILFLPLVNYVLFSFMQQVNMVRLAFTPTVESDGVWSNFAKVFQEFLKEDNMQIALKNSLIFYGLSWAMTPLALFTSYYIYCKYPGRKYFQTMLMLPSIVAGMVWILVYKYFMDLVLPDLMGWDMGLLTNSDTKLLSLIIYSLWFSLGGSLLVYTGMMGSVSEDIREAGRLDGMNRLREFWHLMLPAIYPVFVINTVNGIIGFFSVSGNAFEFYGLDAPTSTLTVGYVMFQSVMGGNSDYGFNSAASLIFTLIVAPLALIAKHLMEKHGPRED